MPKLTQNEIKNLHSLVYVKETEFIIIKIPIKKTQGPEIITGNYERTITFL